MKIAFINDLHLDHQTPSSRTDDYSSSMLSKLQAVSTLCNQHNVDLLICTGDIFHKPSQPVSFLNRVLHTFSQFKVPVYSIAGNHDVAYERADTLERSPYYSLIVSRLVKPLTTLQFPEVNIYGFDYTDTIQPNPTPSVPSILVGHTFFNYGPLAKGREILPEHLSQLNYTYYVLGHDHQPYSDYTLNNATVLRSGSLSRGTAHNSNLYRIPQLLILEITKTTRTHYLVDIPCEDPRKIFEQKQFSKEHQAKDTQLDTIRESVSALLQELHTTSSSSVYDILDVTPVPTEVKELIEKYLQLCSIYRKD